MFSEQIADCRLEVVVFGESAGDRREKEFARLRLDFVAFPAQTSLFSSGGIFSISMSSFRTSSKSLAMASLEGAGNVWVFPERVKRRFPL